MTIALITLLFSSLAFGKNCTYNFDSASAKIQVTGFKFTEKSGVNGHFKDSMVKAPNTAKKLEGILKNATFWIDETTLEFGKPARNKNILKGLFKNIEGRTIHGHVKSVNSKKNTLLAILHWGGKAHQVNFKYTYTNGVFEAKSNIDIIKLGFQKAFDGLHKLCKVHHKGKDGKVKTWSDVDLKVTANILEICS